MRGRINKDENEDLIVVYYKECIEESDAVVPVSCRLMPGFKNLFKVGDNIEFELENFPLEEGGFTTLACPIIRINPHVAKVIDTNEDGEADMGAKLVAMGKTLRSKIYYRITNDGSPFSCGVAMRNAESIEELFDEISLDFLEYYQNNMFSGKLAGMTREEILEKFKKKKGLCK